MKDDCSMLAWGGGGEGRKFLFYILAWGEGTSYSMEHGHLYKEREKAIIESDWKMLIILLLQQ